MRPATLKSKLKLGVPSMTSKHADSVPCYPEPGPAVVRLVSVERAHTPMIAEFCVEHRWFFINYRAATFFFGPFSNWVT